MPPAPRPVQPGIFGVTLRHVLPLFSARRFARPTALSSLPRQRDRPISHSAKPSPLIARLGRATIEKCSLTPLINSVRQGRTLGLRRAPRRCGADGAVARRSCAAAHEPGNIDGRVSRAALCGRGWRHTAGATSRCCACRRRMRSAPKFTRTTDDSRPFYESRLLPRRRVSDGCHSNGPHRRRACHPAHGGAPRLSTTHEETSTSSSCAARLVTAEDRPVTENSWTHRVG